MPVPELFYADLSALAALEEPDPAEVEESRRAARERRDDEALRLHQAKVSYRQIMASEGYTSTSAVHAAVHRARARAAEYASAERRMDQQALLDLAERRMVTILSTAPPAAPAGSDPDTELAFAQLARDHQDRWVKAALGIARLVERGAKLWGTDAPAKRIIFTTEVTPEALAQEREQLRAEILSMGVPEEALPSVERALELMRASVIDTTDTEREMLRESLTRDSENDHGA